MRKSRVMSGGEQKAKPEFSQVIAEFRKECRMTQFRFALELDVKPTTVARWEAGSREPELWNYQKLWRLALRKQKEAFSLFFRRRLPLDSQETEEQRLARIRELEQGSDNLYVAPGKESFILQATKGDELREVSPSPLTRQQRKNLRGQAHTEVDMIFDRAPDQIVKKIMEHLDYYADKFGRAK